LTDAASALERRRIVLGGCVQGVGFRPFVHRLARNIGVKGYVANTRGGVVLEIEGDAQQLEIFLAVLRSDAPPRARVDSMAQENIAPIGDREFSIMASSNAVSSNVDSSLTGALAPPLDLALCENCRAELFAPTDRRFRYPFIACCDCGPRWSALAELPWQRERTALAGFAPCPQCRAEYGDAGNRRFHAENNCCAQCGPQLALWNRRGDILAEREAAVRAAVDALRRGAIVAVKGLGGFHLMLDARSDAAVARLRERKQRPHKPLAVMFETLAQLENYCDCDDAERALLSCAAAPIVLLRSRERLSSRLAPDNPRLGAMLAYTPLHALLLRDAGFPLVATSGNCSGEPICTDESIALEKLGAIADVFLVHDRPIFNPVDDSVAQIAAGRSMLLRAARGFAPLDIAIDLKGKKKSQENILALGGQQKNTVALLAAGSVRVSPHIGDIDNVAGESALRGAVERLQYLCAADSARVVCDAHPDYRSTRIAETFGKNALRVQHHHAHIAAVLAEHGIAWDGSGYGVDGTLWGGEFLLATRRDFRRAATLRDFALPGGEMAAREPRRVALALLHELNAGDWRRCADLPPLRAFSAAQTAALQSMLDRRVNCPRTSSVGRLFDAVAALLGLCAVASFEGQAAMALQFAAERHRGDSVPFATAIDDTQMPYRIDWQPLLAAIIAAIRADRPVAEIAARFHATLAAISAAIAASLGQRRVALAGGCFQNRLLLEMTLAALRERGCEVFWPQRLPPNDGALALGQLTVALARAQPPSFAQ